MSRAPLDGRFDPAPEFERLRDQPTAGVRQEDRGGQHEGFGGTGSRLGEGLREGHSLDRGKLVRVRASGGGLAMPREKEMEHAVEARRQTLSGKQFEDAP